MYKVCKLQNNVKMTSLSIIGKPFITAHWKRLQRILFKISRKEERDYISSGKEDKNNPKIFKI